MDKSNKNLLKTWNDFMAHGRVSEGALRSVVLASWQRCRDMNIDSRGPKIPVILTEEELNAARYRKNTFIKAAIPFMEFLVKAVKGTGFILVLTDSQGTVLELFGDDGVVELARNNNYIPGCRRAETDVGTNAIGLVMVERRPIQLTGPEHWNERHHRWTCVSAPVFSPEEKFLGTVTLSGESTQAHRHTLGMVISAAEAIKNRLRQQEVEREKGRTDVLIESILKSISEAIVTIDSDGVVTHVNSAAMKMLSTSQGVLEGKKISSIFAGGSEIHKVLLGGPEAPPFEVAYDDLTERNYIMLKPYLIQEAGKVEGAILALSERKAFINNVRNLSGFNAPFCFDDIIAQDISILRQIELGKVAAKQDSRVLVAGETGTGKELFAQAIHNESTRCNGPFVAINCAAIPRELIESELMGYRGGAFTGSRKGGQVGKFELADGGTLFLDEIGQMPLDMQAKLLRVLQDSIVTRLGDTKAIKVDVRIIAATNENLFEQSQGGEFRQDLYFRLSVIEIDLPPLRHRANDLACLTEHFLAKIGEKIDCSHISISAAATECLKQYYWPGNIRELENVLEMASVVCEDGLIDINNLPSRVRNYSPAFQAQSQFQFQSGTHSMKEVEVNILRASLKEYDGNIALVSRKLGLSRSTIYRRMKEHDISRSVLIE